MLGAASDQYWDQMSTIMSDADYNRTDESGRMQIWRRGIGYMLQNPILGVGPNNFQTAEGMLSPFAERQQFGVGVRWNAAHNSFVQVGAELGIPGLILFLAIIATAFRSLRRSGRRASAAVAHGRKAARTDAGTDGVADRFCRRRLLSVARVLRDAVHAGRPGCGSAEGDRRAVVRLVSPAKASRDIDMKIGPASVRLGAPIYYGSLRALGVTAMKRRRDAGSILCYHNVVRGDDGGVGDPGLHVSRERFETQMRWLAAHYTVVSLGEFVDRLSAGTSLRSVAAITFDDGYAGVFDHAVPILRTLGLPATVFLVAEAVGRSAGFWWDQAEIVESATPDRRNTWLTALRGDDDAILRQAAPAAHRDLPASHMPADWRTIRASLGRGIDIGVHSATHRSLPTLTDDELEHEVVASRAIVRRATGIVPEFFAYPYGLWDSRVRALVRAAGYRAGVTLDSGLNGAFADPWALRRINVPARISDAAFEAWTAGLHGLPAFTSGARDAR